ncbi:hypothetical protein GQ44DRAFT_767458 [Phaeosphaeriaceae sp. PMI808]|nr:hypothetical protein GQ44DRAFT_767458 [Phaeosphaeriaceae sp. PMI808]
MALAFDLKKSATTKEAQSTAGHSDPEWESFYKYTAEEADQLSSDAKWGSVTASQKTAMFNRINALLEKDDIPKVHYSVFSWRMARKMQSRSYKSGRIKELGSAGPT